MALLSTRENASYIDLFKRFKVKYLSTIVIAQNKFVQLSKI